MIPVYWLAPGDQWDQTMLRDLLDGKLWRPAGFPEFDHRPIVTGLDELVIDSVLWGTGGVLVVPGRYYADETSVGRLQSLLDKWPWALVFITSDEERLFPYKALEGAGRVVWVQTPGEDDGGALRAFGHGYTPGTREVDVQGCTKWDWSFVGQITHPRRHEMGNALRALLDAGGDQSAYFFPTASFNAGIPHDEYLRQVACTKVMPCPSGPATVDSFRFWEALELGCIPLADGLTPKGTGAGYWRDLLDITADFMPITTVADWAEVGDHIDGALADYDEGMDLEIGAWYLGYKRVLAMQVLEDLRSIADQPAHHLGYDDRITVLIGTSPSMYHPDTTQLEEVIASVRFHLPNAPIILSCDGVAPELEHRAVQYREYLRRVMWKCHHEWVNVQPVVHSEHLHQAGVTKYALARYVRTEQILFMEHDTPLVTDEPIDWWLLSHSIADGRLNLVRFHHEAFVPAPHRHLMLDNPDLEGIRYRSVPVIRTMQWSQRPHLARTDWYRGLLDRYFGAESCTMIEDVLHGVVDYQLRERGAQSWGSWKLGIYAPGKNIKRSLHSDGRGSDPKPPMLFAYDGETPEGAPAPTAGRVD